MYAKIILILMILSIPTIADELIIIDTTGSYQELVYVYNDGEYENSLNISGEGKVTFGNNSYEIIIQPTYTNVLSNPTDVNFISYWWFNMRYYFFGFIFLIIMVVITWNLYRR